ncbi:hypothetical protein J4E91_000129 [Alternaria rosae]|nr:hypothetical protein J4E91_000129 [Alternaria rosae]
MKYLYSRAVGRPSEKFWMSIATCVAAEIRLLINEPQSLAGLKWPLKKPKAKGLLKKVEGIKTALILEINIVRLAREEVNRPYPDPDSNGQLQGGPRLNRFRRIVESSVQANRLVVESAQKEDEKLEADTQHHTSAELDIWKSGSSDTATWLYHLVFSPDAASPSSPSPQPRQLHQASVADESAETNTKTGFLLSSEAPIPPKRRPSEPEDKALILWSKQTEPGLVADRLLSSWTTLSSSQIGLSSTRHHSIEGAEDDEWREGILNMAEEEAEKDDNSSFGEWEQENDPIGSDDEAFQSAEEASTIGTNAPPYNFRSNTQKARTRSAKTADHSDSEDALLARVETLLQKRSQEPRVEYEDPPFSRLAKVLQEREVQSERERANAATEARMNQMQVVHEKNEEKVKQLESLVAAQRAEQRRMEVIWEEERKAIEAKATKQAQEVREQAAKEIAAAQMAKETAQAALNVERLETEKEARKRADAIFKAERERTEDFHKLQLHRYEELLHRLREQLLNSEHESDRAIRRTQIAEGNRTVDVIIFPAKADRRSQRMHKLQKSLTRFGIESDFEDPEDLHQLHTSQLVQYDYDNTNDQTVRSTIFWEASALNLGSELLLTMRQAGWRPSYTRISEKGQTHYLGSQPVHTYFFDPDYEPQFSPSETAPGKESITIQKALVEEYALIELGFKFHTNDTGVYVLDGRLTYVKNFVDY